VPVLRLRAIGLIMHSHVNGAHSFRLSEISKAATTLALDDDVAEPRAQFDLAPVTVMRDGRVSSTNRPDACGLALERRRSFCS
jgi:hypothetical protein